jgi:hypothetical protein
MLFMCWEQFELYYEPKPDVLPPIKLSACLSLGDGNTLLLEPLVS